MMLFTTPFAVELSVWTGVGDWGCPTSVRMFMMYTAYFAPINNAPSSAADDMFTTDARHEAPRITMGDVSYVAYYMSYASVLSEL